MSLSPLEPRVIAGAVALMALALLFVFFWNRARLVSFALLFFFLNLAPVLYAPWMAANVFADRYLYFAFGGILLGSGLGGDQHVESGGRTPC